MYTGKLISIEGIPGSPVSNISREIEDLPDPDNKIVMYPRFNFYKRNLYKNLMRENPRKNAHQLLDIKLQHLRDCQEKFGLAEKLHNGNYAVTNRHSMSVIAEFIELGLKPEEIFGQIKRKGVWRPHINFICDIPPEKAYDNLSQNRNYPPAIEALCQAQENLMIQAEHKLPWQEVITIPWEYSETEKRKLVYDTLFSTN